MHQLAPGQGPRPQIHTCLCRHVPLREGGYGLLAVAIGAPARSMAGRCAARGPMSRLSASPPCSTAPPTSQPTGRRTGTMDERRRTRGRGRACAAAPPRCRQRSRTGPEPSRPTAALSASSGRPDPTGASFISRASLRPPSVPARPWCSAGPGRRLPPPSASRNGTASPRASVPRTPGPHRPSSGRSRTPISACRSRWRACACWRLADSRAFRGYGIARIERAVERPHTAAEALASDAEDALREQEAIEPLAGPRDLRRAPRPMVPEAPATEASTPGAQDEPARPRWRPWRHRSPHG